MGKVRLSRRSFMKNLSIGAAVLLLGGRVKGFSAQGAPLKLADAESGDLKRRPVVLRVASSGALKGGFAPERYLDSIDTGRLDEMLTLGVKTVTGKSTVEGAWASLMTGYKSGDRVAIKPNFNFVNHGYRYTITAPELINAVVSQLSAALGVRAGDIYLYDLCKKIPGETVRARIEYPINYVEIPDPGTLSGKVRVRLNYGLDMPDTDAQIMMREAIVDPAGNRVACYMPQVVTMAEHIINMPLLTNHLYISNSGALKNHYGTVRFGNRNLYPVLLHGSVMKKSITDINLNPHIRNKTRVIIADGLFGVFDRGGKSGGGKKAWKTFGNGFPGSIFISRDPVAIDSVMASIIGRERKERGLAALLDEYLAEAMANGAGVCELSYGPPRFKEIDYSTLKV